MFFRFFLWRIKKTDKPWRRISTLCNPLKIRFQAEIYTKIWPKIRYFKNLVKIVAVLGALPSDPRVVTSSYCYKFFEMFPALTCLITVEKRTKVTTENANRLSSARVGCLSLFSSLLRIFSVKPCNLVGKGAKKFFPWRRVS